MNTLQVGDKVDGVGIGHGTSLRGMTVFAVRRAGNVVVVYAANRANGGWFTFGQVRKTTEAPKRNTMPGTVACSCRTCGAPVSSSEASFEVVGYFSTQFNRNVERVEVFCPEHSPERRKIAEAINNPRIVAAVVAGAVNLANDIAARQTGNQCVLPWHIQVEHAGQLRYNKADFPNAATPVMSICLYDAAVELGYDHETARCLATEAARIGLERVHGVKVASVDALRELDVLGSSLAHGVICSVHMGLFMEEEAAA